jgi:hypothetical protein
MQVMRATKLAVVAVALTVFAAGCSRDSAQEAGKKVDDAVQKAKDATAEADGATGDSPITESPSEEEAQPALPIPDA